MPDSPLARLKAFRDSWDHGALICEQCELTRDDLDVLIAQLEPAPAGTTEVPPQVWR